MPSAWLLSSIMRVGRTSDNFPLPCTLHLQVKVIDARNETREFSPTVSVNVIEQVVLQINHAVLCQIPCVLLRRERRDLCSTPLTTRQLHWAEEMAQTPRLTQTSIRCQRGISAHNHRLQMAS